MMVTFWNCTNPERKGRDVSKESTRAHPHRTRCSALHLHFSQLLAEDRAHRLVWDTSSFYSSKIKFGCLVNKYGLPTYLKNINWVKIASGFCEESGSLRNLIVHSRQSHMNHVEKGTKISVLQRGEIVQFCCSSHVLFNPNHQTVTLP